MRLILEVFKSLCSTKIFKINGYDATYEDFGTKQDIGYLEDGMYGCADMQFTYKLATQHVLDKYNISVTDYNNICKQLKEKLSFGECGKCN